MAFIPPRFKFPGAVIAIEVCFIVLFTVFVRYGPHSDAKLDVTFRDGFPIPPLRSSFSDDEVEGTLDAQGLIVGGLTLIFTFVHRYAFSTAGLSLLIVALTAQWGVLCRGFFRYDEFIPMDTLDLVYTIYFACSVMLSWGCVLGATSPMQVLVLILLEIPIGVANEYVITDIFKINDPGGTVVYNTFGTVFGLAMARVLYHPAVNDHSGRETTYASDMHSIIGTLLLWIFWPGAMASLFFGSERRRCYMNTYMSLTGSTIIGIALSAILDKRGKWTISHLQNTTLAGAVAVSGVANTMMGLWGAMLLGFGAGTISVLGFKYVQPFLASHFKINDVCGCNNLHGMPAIYGGFVAAAVAAIATEDLYGPSLYTIYPAMAPLANTTELEHLQSILPTIKAGYGRTAAQQAYYQLYALGVTLGVSTVGGLLTGFVMKFSMFDVPDGDQMLDDSVHWNEMTGYPNSLPHNNFKSTKDFPDSTEMTSVTIMANRFADTNQITDSRL